MIQGICWTNEQSLMPEDWPTHFIEGVKVGDTVRSRNGKIAVINELSHGENNGVALLKIKLGKPVLVERKQQGHG